MGNYLPGYPNKAVATKVALHHLLTHTGGTGDIFGAEYDPHRLSSYETHHDYVVALRHPCDPFRAGRPSRTRNYGIVLLGLVIEA